MSASVPGRVGRWFAYAPTERPQGVRSCATSGVSITTRRRVTPAVPPDSTAMQRGPQRVPAKRSRSKATRDDAPAPTELLVTKYVRRGLAVASP